MLKIILALSIASLLVGVLVLLKVSKILKKEKVIMGDLENLNATEQKIESDVAALAVQVGNINTTLASEAAQIKALQDEITTLQNGGGATPQQLQDLNAKLGIVSTNIETQTAALATALAAVTPPPPAPAT